MKLRAGTTYRSVFVIITVAIVIASGEDTLCSTKEFCDDCIRTRDCVWCSAPDTKGTLLRCMNKTLETSGWCSDVVNPETIRNTTDDKPLRGSEDDSQDDVVQLRPQRVKLRMRVGETFELPIQYKQAQDYPVDLYYLMDLSKSMEDDKDKLSQLGDILSETMKNLTRNFRLGFGSFVDKVLMPYTSTVPQNLKVPCRLNNNTPCAPPYGFKNNMPLTSKTEEFSQRVSSSGVSGNLDSPEGTLDAIMQAMACSKEIGWRERARRLLVVSTDAGYHLAGDGRLAGLVEPNDAKCHLNENGEYTHHNITDYPSISQINQKAKETNINIIFAVTFSQKEVYKNLASRIEGASYGELSKDSKNVVELVQQQYEKLVSGVKMKHNSSSSVEVTFYSKCPGSDTERQTDYCGDLRNRPTVDFKVKFQVVSCPENKKDWNQTIVISPIGINETLTIDLEIICECDCSRKGHQGFEVNSEKCSNHGSLSCGVCLCDSSHIGRMCECDGNSPTLLNDTSSCTDNATGIMCSNAGQCRCNKCTCNKRNKAGERIYGNLCECNNYSCDQYKGQVCSGPEHGVCDCNQCHCYPGWRGTACECSTKSEKCRKPGDEIECSGRGNCTCDRCECDSDPETGYRYSGKYCQDCPWCSETKCQEIKDCVECMVDKDKSCVNELCASANIVIIDELDEIEMKQYQKCLVKDKQKCNFEFYFSESEGVFKVWAVPDRSCDANIWAVVFGVIGSTVLIGLLIIIIWKVLTTIHDKREYAKFEKERALSKWGRDDNPLYKPSTTTFTNPTFGKE